MKYRVTNTIKVKSVLLILGLITLFYSLNGQNLTFEYGAMFVPHKSESELHPDIRSDSYLTGSQNFLKINYEHCFKKNLFLIGSFTKHEVNTSMDFYRGEDASWDVGWIGTDVTRIDFSLMYNVFSKSKFIIQPYGGLGFLRSNPGRRGFSGVLLGQWIESGQPNVRILKEPEGEAFLNSQIVPVLGLKFGYALWDRLELFIDIHGVYGHKTIQDFSISYSYNGIEQPEANSYADGSGWFLGYGIGWRFVKAKKSK